MISGIFNGGALLEAGVQQVLHEGKGISGSDWPRRSRTQARQHEPRQLFLK